MKPLRPQRILPAVSPAHGGQANAQNSVHNNMKQFAKVLVCLAVLWLGAATAFSAGSTVQVGGIVVRYSLPGMDAYFDPDDGTLTIEISQSGGALSVTATPAAASEENWGPYADIYLLADGISFRSIKLNGRPDCRLFITGQCHWLQSWSSNWTVVGDTDAYGSRGLGASSPNLIPSIKLKNGWTVGPLAGVDYTPQAADSKSANAKGSSAGTAKSKAPQK